MAKHLSLQKTNVKIIYRCILYVGYCTRNPLTGNEIVLELYTVFLIGVRSYQF